MTSGPHPLSLLLRGFCVDWIAGAQEQAASKFLAPTYTAHVGGVTFAGLEQYIPAVLGQLHTYPGLSLTVHDVLLGDEGIAMVFSEHGAVRSTPCANMSKIISFITHVPAVRE